MTTHPLVRDAVLWVRDPAGLLLGGLLVLAGAATHPGVVAAGWLFLGWAGLVWFAESNGYAMPRPGWTPILQYGCWEAPLAFAVRRRHRLLLFWREFQPAAADYANAYAVYELPPMSDADVKGDWPILPRLARRSLGVVPVDGLRLRHSGCHAGPNYVSTVQVESALRA